MNNYKHHNKNNHDNKKDDSCCNISTGGHTKHGASGMSHGSATDFLRRFWIVTFLLIPLIFTNEFVAGIIGRDVLPFSKWIGFGIATIIFGFSLVFFKHAWHEIKSRRYGMMTLVSLAVGAGYLFSATSTFLPALEVEFYLEISTLIWVLLFGHYLEARSSSSAGDALQEVAKLLPKKAHRLRGDVEMEDVDTTELIAGDIVLVKPGEKVPADGVIIRGSSNVDESLISGESKPVRKEDGDEVVAGSICLDGSLTVKLSRVGENSTVGQIQKLIVEAQSTKPRSQRIADKASAILVFVAGITALLTILIWTIILGEPFVFAITLAITVLVIACPHALGLAIPTVTTITTTLAIKNGVFIKNLAKIEIIKKANYIVFDKTGTLTSGEFGVTNIKAFDGINERDVVRVASSLERNSSHIIGRAIVKYAKDKKIELAEIDNFKNIAGKGISADINGKKYLVGNQALMQMQKIDISTTVRLNLTVAGTTVYVADNENIFGVITLADKIKDESYKAVKDLHSLGVKVAMLTGDNKKTAENVAKELNIDTYFAEVLPEDKYKHIKELQEKGNVALMVGDGVNDAPALTQADVGIAIGTGTDIAVEAGDVVLIRNNPQDIVRLLILSRKVYSKMIQNLVWALGYNIVAIPMAAGVFATFGFFLRPEIGALFMSLSTVIVVANAMMLKKVDLENI
jgi:P-type Cu2+ transporter